MPPKGLLSWLTPFLAIRLFWRAVGIHSNAPLTSLLHGRSNNKILLLNQEDIVIKIKFFNVTKEPRINNLTFYGRFRTKGS